MNLTICLQLAQRLIMSGATSPLHYMHRDNFTFYLCTLRHSPTSAIAEETWSQSSRSHSVFCGSLSLYQHFQLSLSLGTYIGWIHLTIKPTDDGTTISWRLVMLVRWSWYNALLQKNTMYLHACFQYSPKNLWRWENLELTCAQCGSSQQETAPHSLSATISATYYPRWQAITVWICKATGR
jgi:hypothetical protein